MNDDLERAVRERVRDGFAPAPADDHAQSVRAKVTQSRSSRRLPGGREAWVVAAALAGVVLAATIVYPRMSAYRPALDADPTWAPATGDGTRWPTATGTLEAGPSEITPPTSELAADGHRRADLVDARRHLSFEPALPLDGDRHAVLLSLKTLSQRNGALGSAEPDNVLVVVYENELSLIEAQLDRGSESVAADFMRLLRQLGRETSGAVRTRAIHGTTVFVWDSPPGAPRTESRVYWFRGDVGYALTAPGRSSERLLTLAGTMLR